MEELEIFVRLTHLPGFGHSRIRKLIAHFGEAKALWHAEAKEVSAVLGTEQLEGVWRGKAKYEEWLKDLTLAEEHGVSLLPYWSDDYPHRLLNISDPPILLYVKGRLGCIDHNAVAIVGTRSPTPYGLSMAAFFAETLAAAGTCVISGLARGIDGAAHRGALKHGFTAAVIGSGLANIYPPDHGVMAEEISQKGALISELPMATPPDRQCFPQRNRIVSGLAKALLLIEAPIKSGAMITMQQARKEGRSCFAIPGRLDYPSFAGNHTLLQKGEALLALSPNDLLSSMGDLFGQPSITHRISTLSVEEQTLLTALPAGEYSVDEICRLTQWNASKVGTLLMGLMLKECIQEYPGKRYKKLSNG